VKGNTERYSVDMFPVSERLCPSHEREAHKIHFVNHLRTLQKRFSLHFKDRWCPI